MRRSYKACLFFLLLLMSTIGSTQAKFQKQLEVYFFLATSCPISQQYTKEISRLNDEYAKKGINMILVFPNDGKKSIIKKIKSFIRTYELNLRFINDKEFKLAKKYNASITPEAFLISEGGIILYHGAIDNWYFQLGKNRMTITEHYLEDAMLEALQEKAITKPYAEPIGCFIEVAQIKR